MNDLNHIEVETLCTAQLLHGMLSLVGTDNSRQRGLCVDIPRL